MGFKSDCQQKLSEFISRGKKSIIVIVIVIVSISFTCLGNKSNQHCEYYHLLKESNLIAELPVIRPLSINGSYTEGSSVNISCTATGKPDPEVSWVRNGQIKSSGMKIAYLNFDKIKRTDDGLYTCSANNSAGTKTHEEILVVRCESENI